MRIKLLCLIVALATAPFAHAAIGCLPGDCDPGHRVGIPGIPSVPHEF